MKTCAIVLGVLIPIAAFAKDKPEQVWQEGTLLDFHLVDSGQHCSTSANTNGTVKDNGNVTATTNGSTNCANTRMTVYRVELDGHTYTLEPYVDPRRVAVAVVPIVGLAYLLATNKESVLYGVLPGTRILLRSEAGGIFYVKVGKKESRYKLAGAE